MNQKYDQMWFTFLIKYDFWLPQLWQHLVGILMAASFHLLLSLEFAEPSKEGQRFNCQHYPHSLPRPIIIRTLSHFSGPKLAQSLRVGIKRQLDRDSIVGEKKQPHLTTSLEWREEENSSALSSLLVWPLLLGIFWQHFWSFCKLWSCSKPFRNCWPDINDFDILLYWCKRWKAFVRQLIHSAYWINHYLCCWPWCSHNVRIKEVSRHVNKQQLLPTSQITFVIHSTNNIVSHFTNNISHSLNSTNNICWSQNQQLCGDSCF